MGVERKARERWTEKQAEDYFRLSRGQMWELAENCDVPGAILENGDWTFDAIKLKKLFADTIREMEQKKKAKLRARYDARVTKASTKLLDHEAILAAATPQSSKRCGIYFLINGGKVVYVGQARNVFARVGQHTTSKAFTAWHWVWCHSSQLNVMERAYINALRPELNRDPVTRRLRNSWEMEKAHA